MLYNIDIAMLININHNCSLIGNVFYLSIFTGESVGKAHVRCCGICLPFLSTYILSLSTEFPGNSLHAGRAPFYSTTQLQRHVISLSINGPFPADISK